MILNSPSELYFIAIVLPDELSVRVRNIQEDFARRFNSERALHSPPHITLQAPFKFLAESEEKLKSELDNFAKQQVPLKIELSGFDCFKNRNKPVIFVRIVENTNLIHLQKRLVAHIENQQIIPADKERRDFHPHCTVAFRDLSFTSFNKAWKEFEPREFEGSCRIDQVCLLKSTRGFWIPSHFAGFQPE